MLRLVADLCNNFFKSLRLIILCCVLSFFVYISELNDFNIVANLLSAVIAWLVEQTIFSLQNLFDVSSWKKEQRKLERGQFIKRNSYIRISFAYLFRIKVDGKYLLVKNSRNTGKYQPVGGVYKMLDSEKRFLASKYGCMDDNMISVDESSKNDYRLRVKNRYLREFVNRFNKEISRESIGNISREFKEELIDTGILSQEIFKQIQYEYVGRYYNGVKFTPHFGCYELLLGDVVSLMPSQEQENELRKLLNSKQNDTVAFFSDEMISHLGIDKSHNLLKESIADHTINVLESKIDDLERAYKKRKVYDVSLN